jgi:hypothetical protein
MAYELDNTRISLALYESVVSILQGIVACEQENTVYYHDQFLEFPDCEFDFRKVRSDYDHNTLASNQRQCAWYLQSLRQQKPETIVIPDGRVITNHDEEIQFYEMVCNTLRENFPKNFHSPGALERSPGLEQISLEFRPLKKENSQIYFKKSIDVRHIFPISQRQRLKQVFEQSGLFKTAELAEKTLCFF